MNIDNKTKYIIIGTIAVSLIIFAIYNYRQRHNNYPKIFYKDNLPFNYNANTIPPFGIFISKKEKGNGMLLKHEMVHWNQYQKEGLLKFCFGYIKENIKNGYDGNKYEKEALIKSGEKAIDNYTNSVRNGTALTIYNPNFRK